MITCTFPPGPGKFLFAEEPDGPLWQGEAVEITVMMQYISKYLGKRFLYDPAQLRGKKVAVLSESRIPREAVYRVFESILNMNGFVLVDYKDYVRLEPVQSARHLQTQVLDEKQAAAVAGEDRMVTRVFQLEHSDSNVLMQVLQKFINPQSESIVALPDTNTLVVTGFVRGIERIAQVIKASDRPGPEVKIAMIELNNARVDEISKLLQPLVQSFAVHRKMLGAQALKLPPPQAVASNRTNTVVVSGTEEEIQQLRDMVVKLDSPGLDVKTDSIVLEYAAAEDVSAQLQSLVKIFAADRAKPGLKNGLAQIQVIADERTNQVILTGTDDELKSFREMIARLDVEVPEAETSVQVFQVHNVDAADLVKVIEKVLVPSRSSTGPGKPQPNVIRPGARKSNDRFIGEVELVAQGGSIVARASKAGLKKIEALIQELDVRKAKVLIEAAIVELTVGKDFDLGVELATVDKPNKSGSLFGATNFGLSNLLDNDGDGVPETRVPILGPGDPGIIAGIVKDRQGKIPLLIKALDSRTKVRVLAAPMVVADDNEEASFKASDQFPVATFTTTQSTTDVTSFGRFEEAVIELIITPGINEKDGYLRLDIHQTVEVFKGNPPAQNLPPRKDTREVKAIVTVPDGRTVVIGGLSNNSTDRTLSGIPFLHRIPLLGVLFRRKQDKDKQTRLYAFVSATILKDESFEDFEKLTQEKRKELDDLLKKQEEEEKPWGKKRRKDGERKKAKDN